MRALIVSDVHSNLAAFKSVIADAERRGGFSEIWSLGDLVGYGPEPSECIELLRSHPHYAIIGNHDLAAVGRLSLHDFNAYAAAANRWTATQISREQAEFIAAQPLTLERDEFTLVHGSPRDPVWEYVLTERAALACMTHIQTYWCVVGHSHVPFICRRTQNGAAFIRHHLDAQVPLDEDGMVINPGSVGQPRDGDARASYAIYDAHAQAVSHHRVPYDIRATQTKMEQHGLPQYLVDRLSVGR